LFGGNEEKYEWYGEFSAIEMHNPLMKLDVLKYP
jgi:hypothetical protein